MKIVVAIVSILILSCFALYEGNGTKKSYMDTIEYKERLAAYEPIDLGINYTDQIECKLRDRTLKRKFGRE